MMTPCVFGVLQTDCLQARFAGGGQSWGRIYGGIRGFDYVAGSRYRLLVLETRIENPPADGAAINYSFIKMLSQKSLTPETDSLLVGNWQLAGFNDTAIPTSK